MKLGIDGYIGLAFLVVVVVCLAIGFSVGCWATHNDWVSGHCYKTETIEAGYSCNAKSEEEKR